MSMLLAMLAAFAPCGFGMPGLGLLTKCLLKDTCVGVLRPLLLAVAVVSISAALCATCLCRLLLLGDVRLGVLLPLLLALALFLALGECCFLLAA